jgi:hypothetical protein
MELALTHSEDADHARLQKPIVLLDRKLLNHVILPLLLFSKRRFRDMSRGSGLRC